MTTEPNDQATPVDDNGDAEDTTIEDSALDPRAREALRKARSEAHSLRTRLRDTEEQLGIASARLSAHHRAAVAAAAKPAGLIDGEDLLSVHPDPAEFLDEQFADVVPDKVAEATKALIAQKPYLSRPSGPPPTDRPIESLRPGASPLEDKPTKPSWATALRGTGI